MGRKGLLRDFPPARALIGAALALVAVIVIAGCGSSSSDTTGTSGSSSGSGTSSSGGGESVEGKHVALISCTEQVPWCAAYNKAVKSGLEAEGVSVTVLTDPYEPALENQHMNQVIAEKPDAIVLVAANESAIIPAVARAKAAGIPVINTDAPLAEGGEEQIAFQVVADHEAIGRFAGEGIVEGLEEEGKKTGNVFVAAGALAMPSAHERLVGLKNYMKKYPQYKIVNVTDVAWDENKAFQAASQIIAQYRGQGGIQAAYGMNDLLALAIVKAAEQAGEKVGYKEDGMIVVGGNCLSPGVPAIRDGKLYSGGTQTPIPEGELVVEHTLAFLRGEEQEKTIVVPEYRITRENLHKYAKECTF